MAVRLMRGRDTMRIAQISDTHEGITKLKSIRKMLLNMKKEYEIKPFDALLHCGDFCGGRKGYKTLRSTTVLMRSIFPDIPIIAVMGNHDFWYRNSRRDMTSEHEFFKNYDKCVQAFKENNVHFLDEDGIYVHNDDVIIMGNSGWYNKVQPPTNDANFLPQTIEGKWCHSWLNKRANDGWLKQYDDVTAILEDHHTVCFVSHFPVIKQGKDHKGGFEEFSWDEMIGDHLQLSLGVRYFFCGHAHQLHKGPLRYECGPDYYNPAYQIVDVV